MLTASLLVPDITVTISGGGHITIGQAHQLCASAIGGLVQAASPQASQVCGKIAAAEDAITAGRWAGIALIAVPGAVAWARLRKSPAAAAPGFSGPVRRWGTCGCGQYRVLYLSAGQWRCFGCWDTIRPGTIAETGS